LLFASIHLQSLIIYINHYIDSREKPSYISFRKSSRKPVPVYAVKTRARFAGLGTACHKRWTEEFCLFFETPPKGVLGDLWQVSVFFLAQIYVGSQAV